MYTTLRFGCMRRWEETPPGDSSVSLMTLPAEEGGLFYRPPQLRSEPRVTSSAAVFLLKDCLDQVPWSSVVKRRGVETTGDAHAFRITTNTTL